MIHHEFIIDLVHQKDFNIPKDIRILVRFTEPDHTPPAETKAYYYISPEPEISPNQIPGIDYQLRYCEQHNII